MSDSGAPELVANDTEGDALIKQLTDVIDGTFASTDEPLTTEDILKTINDCTAKSNECEDVGIENVEIDSTLVGTDFQDQQTDGDDQCEAVVIESEDVSMENSTENEDVSMVNSGEKENIQMEISGEEGDVSVENSREKKDVSVENSVEDKDVDSVEKSGEKVDPEHSVHVKEVDSGNTEENDSTPSIVNGGEVTMGFDKKAINDDNGKLLNVDQLTKAVESEENNISEASKQSNSSVVTNGDEAISEVTNGAGIIPEVISEYEKNSQLLDNDTSNIVLNDVSTIFDEVDCGDQNSKKSDTQENSTPSSGPVIDKETAMRNRQYLLSQEKMPIDPVALDAGILAEQVPSPLCPEELEKKSKMFSLGNPAVQFFKLHCTACNVHLGSAVKNIKDRYIHPILKVLICKKCYDFYTSGDFDKDEDGYELYCRWCGQGGNVLCCTYCEFVFCKKCIRTNLGKKKLEYIKKIDDWVCFVCDISQAVRHRITAVALFEYITEELKRMKMLNIPELEANDYTMCCKGSPGTQPRKRFHNFADDYGEKKKPKPRAPRTQKPKPAIAASVKDELGDGSEVAMGDCLDQFYEEPFSLANQIMDTQQGEEVVCAPDLSMLMEEDDTPTRTSSPPPPPPPLVATNTSVLCSLISQPSITTVAATQIQSTQLPPLTPMPSYIRVRNVANLLPGKKDDAQAVGMIPPVVHRPPHFQGMRPVRMNKPIFHNFLPPRGENRTGSPSSEVQYVGHIVNNGVGPNKSPLFLPPFIRIAPRHPATSQATPVILNRLINAKSNVSAAANKPNTASPSIYSAVQLPSTRFTTATTAPPAAVRPLPPPHKNLIRVPTMRPAQSAAAVPPASASNISYVNNIPARFLPGIKHEWFDSAEAVTRRVASKLVNTLNTLTREKDSVRSIEDLANVHNKLQEGLSSSINTLIQVRRNLRNEFMKGLDKIKRCPERSERVGNVAVLPTASTVSNNSSNNSNNKEATVAPQPLQPPPLQLLPLQSPPAVIVSEKPKTYLKVKSILQLHNVTSECITLPEVVARPSEQAPELPKLANPIVIDESPPYASFMKKIEEVEPGNSLVQGERMINEVVIKPVKNDEKGEKEVEECRVVSVTLSKDEFEKKLKALTEENMKKYRFNLDVLTLKEIKYMMSARVHVQDICKASILQALLNKSSKSNSRDKLNKISKSSVSQMKQNLSGKLNSSSSKDDLLNQVLDNLSKSSIKWMKRKLSNKLKISRVRNNSPSGEYAIIHSSNSSDSGSSQDDTE